MGADYQRNNHGVTQMQLSKNGVVKIISCALFWAWVFIVVQPLPSLAAQDTFPEPNPPFIDLGESDDVQYRVLPQAPLSAQEWTFHKSADNLHPDGNEQQFMWLMNRARANPTHEGYWLAHTGESEIIYALGNWNVNLTVMQNEFNGYIAKPPAAFDVRLYNAAKAHSEELIARDAQDHTGQFAQIDPSGFHYTVVRGNVFSYTSNALYGHAAFNIDWGYDNGDGSGMQDGRGHRMAIMSIDREYTNVGLAVVAESDPGTSVGPLVTTGNFCNANTSYANHYNRFLVGTVWQDANNNDQYDPGEGMAGITVIPNSGTYYAVTANSGGYAFPIESSGAYDITFSGSGISTSVTRAIAVDSSDSVLLDLEYTAGGTEPVAVTGAASNVTTSAANLDGTVHTHGNDTDYYFQYGTSTNYTTSTAVDTVSTDSTVTAVVTGLIPNTRYHFRLVATHGGGSSFGSDRTFQTTASPPTDSGTPSAPNTGSSGGGGCFIMITGMP